MTGANGFIAGHAIGQLLAAGHEVIGTVREPSKVGRVAHLRAMPGADRLSIVAADLLSPDAFLPHVDVDVVLHMASPYAVDVSDPKRDLLVPAVEGTLSVLRAASTSTRARRVVLTSSMAAITDEPDGRILTEADWNTKSSLARNPYYYSKTMAERAAWDFIAAEKPGFDLVVMNPFLVIGPSMTVDINTSNQTFVDMLAGVYPAVMALDWGIVDVRDVAAAHVRAVDPQVPPGRYILAAGNMTMAEAVAQMRAEGYTGKLPKLSLTGGIGTVLTKLAALSQPAGVRTYLRTHLGRHPRFDNAKSRSALGLAYRSPASALTDTLADLARWGHIRERHDP